MYSKENDIWEPLTGFPRDVFPSLVQWVNSLANNRDIEEFYIGRGVDLSERMSYHGSHDIIPVYSTESVNHAIDIEGALINRFYNHPKCNNDATHGGGGVSEEYAYYVYVAIWMV